MLKPQPSAQFKRDLKRAQKQGKDIDLLKKIIKLLSNKKELPKKYCDHLLSGNWNGYRECHINPDWLLIYKVDQKKGLLQLMRVNNHANIFKK